jgi:hypothetical protein
LVNVIDQVAPDVPAVFELVPVHPVNWLPTVGALLRLVVIFVRSVLSAAKMLMVDPAVGAVLDVMVVPVWAPILAIVLTKLAHCVAVTVLVALTVDNAVCPHPLSPDPVDQTSLTLAFAVVLANPL